MRPVCVPCSREMLVVKNGFVVITGQRAGNIITVRRGDLYRCPDCGAQVVTGFGAPVDVPKWPSDVEARWTLTLRND